MTSKNSSPALRVVVATHERPDSLDRLLNALSRQSLPPDRFLVVVVNDGSHDERYARVLERYPSVRYLPLARRSGPATARNRGATGATGEWIVFTDDDCLPPSDWLERFWSSKDGDAVGGKVALAPGKPLGAVARCLQASNFIRPYKGPDGRIFCLPTANLGVRRTSFEAVGGFDVRFPRAGGEDMDLTYRLLKSGAKAVIAESWVTYHEAPEGFAEFCGRYFRYGYGETLFRRLRGDEGHPPSASYYQRTKDLLGLTSKAANPRAPGELSFILLTATRQTCFELGKLCGRWQTT